MKRKEHNTLNDTGRKCLAKHSDQWLDSTKSNILIVEWAVSLGMDTFLLGQFQVQVAMFVVIWIYQRQFAPKKAQFWLVFWFQGKSPLRGVLQAGKEGLAENKRCVKEMQSSSHRWTESLSPGCTPFSSKPWIPWLLQRKEDLSTSSREWNVWRGGMGEPRHAKAQKASKPFFELLALFMPVSTRAEQDRQKTLFAHYKVKAVPLGFANFCRQ